MEIDVDFIAALPDDLDAAFLEMERWLEYQLRKHRDNNNWDAEQFYINGLRAFAISYGDEELARRTDVVLHPDHEPWNYFGPIKNHIDQRKMLTAFAVARQRRREQTSIGLTPDARQQIHTYISSIRTALHQIDLPDPKRESIFKALNKLAHEIDTNRTWFESIADLALRLSDTVDEVDKKLNPVRRVFEKILKRLGELKDEADKLPPPARQDQIEGPKPEEDCRTAGDLDDEIPF